MQNTPTFSLPHLNLRNFYYLGTKIDQKQPKYNPRYPRRDWQGRSKWEQWLYSQI